MISSFPLSIAKALFSRRLSTAKALGSQGAFGSARLSNLVERTATSHDKLVFSLSNAKALFSSRLSTAKALFPRSLWLRKLFESFGMQGGCIIRAGFLNDIKAAYKREQGLKNLLIDPFFSKKMVECEQDWRKVVALAITNGVAAPGMTASISYFDTYKRDRLPANLVQVSQAPANRRQQC